MRLPDRGEGGFRSILADPSVRAVVLVAFVMMLGAGIVLPVLPLFARSFDVGYGGAGVLVAAYGLARLVFDLVAGLVVDSLGERPSAAAGFGVAAAFSLLTALAPTFSLAVLAWGATGAGSALAFAALYSYLLRVVPQGRMARTLSIFYGAFNVGVVAGGLLGGVVAHRFGLVSPLYIDAALLAVAAVVYVRLVPPAVPAGRVGPSPAGRPRLLRVLRTPGLGTVAVTNLAYLFMVAAVFDTLVPLFGRDGLDMSTVGIGAVIAVSLAAEFAVLYPAGAAADRYGRKGVLVPALAALAVVTVVVGWAGTPVVFGAMLAALGIASGVAGVPPGAMLSDVVVEGQSGTAVGIFRFFGDLGFTLGPLLAGFASEAFGFKEAFALACVPTVVALAFVIRVPETMRAAELAP